MAKFLVLYRSSMSAADQMTQGSPETAAAGMDAWLAWAQRPGMPSSTSAPRWAPLLATWTAPAWWADSRSFRQSQLSVVQLLEGHPHTEMGGTIQVPEFLSMPGMW